MYKGLMRQWMADRLDRVDSKPGSGGIPSLSVALQPAPGLYSLALPNPFPKISPRFPNNVTLITYPVCFNLITFLMAPWSGEEREAVVSALSFQD